MPPPRDGNTRLPFVDLIRLEQINDVTYRSIALPFAPGGPVGNGRSYGGHVYMQAAWAACQTVGKGYLIHNISGSFLLPGLPHIPYIYKVHPIRNGRSYKTRIVNVTQATGSGICFTSTISFAVPEPSHLSTQAPLDLYAHYSSVLSNKPPTSFEELPSMDVPWYLARRASTGINDDFPGLESYKVPMGAYNTSLPPLERRQLIFYRPIGGIPADEPNMHLCLHLYASDRNSLYIIANHLEVGDAYTQMGSLVHSTVFHSPIEDLMFPSSTNTSSSPASASASVSPLDDPEGRFFAREDWTTRLGSGRGMFHSRMWNGSGDHVATSMQEGMIRFTKGPVATKEETALLAERKGRWLNEPGAPKGKL